jgi:hypothetical protein
MYHNSHQNVGAIT